VDVFGEGALIFGRKISNKVFYNGFELEVFAMFHHLLKDIGL
jgi:hypothetical protein